MNRHIDLCHGSSSHRSKARMYLILVWQCLHVSLALFPSGPGAGDTEITSDRSSLISLNPAFPFYGLNLSSLMVYTDGFFCFDNTPRDLYMLEKDSSVNFPAIAVWASAVRTSHKDGVGSVTYRLTRNDTLLHQLSDKAGHFSEFNAAFYPLYAVVVTWRDVGTVHYDEVFRSKKNTFQALLATDGRQSLAWVEYSTIQWIYDGPGMFYDDGGTIDTVDYTRAQAGFYKGDGATKHLLPMSFRPGIRDINTASNADSPGVYIFRIDTTPVNVTVRDGSVSTTHHTRSPVSMTTAQASTPLTHTSTTTTSGSLVTGSNQAASLDTVDGPVVGMSVACATVAMVTIVALILVFRLHIKNRRRRFHGRKVGPEEQIATEKGNRQSQSGSAQAAQRVQLHSASSVASTAGIRVIEY